MYICVRIKHINIKYKPQIRTYKCICFISPSNSIQFPKNTKKFPLNFLLLCHTHRKPGRPRAGLTPI